MDAGKIMWVMYEHPEVDFMDMAMRFMDIRKRIYTFPKMGEKAYFIAIPTSSGTGSEVTPFAVITDEESGIKYPLADYELLPKMAIVDADMMMNQPKGLTSASGIDALTHALEAYASIMATDYTDGLALKSYEKIYLNIFLPHMKMVRTTQKPVNRWLQLQPWPEWHLQMHFLEYATLWLTSSVHTTTFLMVLQTHSSSLM